MLVNCRLCLTEIRDTNVTLLEGIIRDMMEIIVPELNFSICESPSICKGCLETLKQSYSFKSSCLEIEDKIQDFVNPKNPSLIDLKEVLRKTKNVRQIPGEADICRTCLSIGESSYTKLCSYEGDPLQNMAEKCLPEMGLELTKDPSICPTCLEQLEEQFHFIMQCLDTEAKITFYTERKHINKNVNLQSVYLFSMYMEDADELDRNYGLSNVMENMENDSEKWDRSEDSILKGNLNGSYESRVKNIKNERDENDLMDLTEDAFPKHIKEKFEKYDVKLETESPSKLSKLKNHVQNSKKLDKPAEEVTFELKKNNEGEEVITSKTSEIHNDWDMSKTGESDLLVVKKVTSTRGRKRVLNNFEQKPKTKMEYKDDDGYKSEEEKAPKKKFRRTRKCKYCAFKTKFTSRMKAHMTVNHPDEKKEEPPEVKGEEEKIFNCRRCVFKTPDLAEFKSHKFEHKKERQQKCPHCSMVFVRHDFLKKHVENHGSRMNSVDKITSSGQSNRASKKRSSLPMSPTIMMTKKPNYRFSINGQVLKMFKCRICPYQTRMKSCYDKHSQNHKTSNQLKVHKCTVCNFETIQKENYLTHMQSHEHEGENRVMKCFLCSYQPATEAALRQHVNQVHKWDRVTKGSK